MKQPNPAREGVPDAEASISRQEFDRFRQLIFDQAGITLADSKMRLVTGRLAKRLRHHGLKSYGEYLRRLAQGGLGAGEMQTMVDLLTTNETHFFRESAHFEFLQQEVLSGLTPGRGVRIWSAACSTGEEPYSLAMTCAETLGEGPWEVLGSDINTSVLAKARSGHYSMDRARGIPQPLLKRYCLKGKGSQEGTFLIIPELRRRVTFKQLNLNASLSLRQPYDVIFLRNVMIYFSLATKQAVVARMLPLLKPGGHFVVGHSESLNGVTDELQLVKTTIYRKPG